jgi:hypothetical protein
VWVTVHNEGTVRADIWSEAEYLSFSGGTWEQSLDTPVPPNQSTKFGFRFDELNRLKVRITRSSDQFTIFDDFWDRSDLEHLNEEVVISISP